MKRQIKDYVPGLRLRVNDTMQERYSYTLQEKYGNVDPRMKAALSPRHMLVEGVFSGKYMNDCRNEFPTEWYTKGKFSIVPDAQLNRFRVKSRLSLSEWRTRGWIVDPDIRGWFQWWCRYYIGRRIPGVDDKNISRWRSYKRHAAQVRINASKEGREGDETFRPSQRQGLLQWAHDPFPDY
jgi:hypothetical protein